MSRVVHIVKLFGGTRRMAGALKLPPSTIQSWKDSGFIPARRQQQVLDAARDLGIALAPEDFFEPRPASTAPEDATEHTRASAAA